MTSRSRSTSQYNRPTPYEMDRMGTLNAIGSLSNINPNTSMSNAVPLSTSYLPHSGQYAANSSVPPPVPPRLSTTRSVRSGYSGMNDFYSPYSRFSPGMYNPMGAYGGFRSPYSRFGGMPPESYNSFIQLAEESTRPAFESIESVVDIVSSISMMLESTYHAVYSSYSAIIGVVEQFSRLKDHLAEVLSFLALLRGLKYLCYKILYLLRLRKDNPSVEAAWNTAISGSNVPGFSSDKKSPWPFFMFVGLVIGAPWLMFKLLARSVAVKKPFDINRWRTPEGHLLASIAAYDFNTERREELSFKAGDTLILAPKHLHRAPQGWYLACHKQNKQVGLIPQNYLKSAVRGLQRTLVRPDSNNEIQSTPENVPVIPVGPSNDSTPVEGQNSVDNIPDPFIE